MHLSFSQLTTCPYCGYTHAGVLQIGTNVIRCLACDEAFAAHLQLKTTLTYHAVSMLLPHPGATRDTGGD